MSARRVAVVGAVMAVVAACGGASTLDGAPPAQQSDAGVSCGPGTLLCGAACVEPSYNPANCGACGNVCPADQVCFAGKCGVACLGGTTACGQSCVDLHYDPLHCGACDTKCASGVACLGGRCAGDCTNTATTCKGGYSFDAGPPQSYCAELATDPSNCGACGHACPMDYACAAGECTCPSGKTLCSYACVDVQTDHDHCGVCGVACAAEAEVCTAGACVCAQGYSLCGKTCTNLDVRLDSCGTCGHACASGQVCTDGVCGAPTGDWPTFGGDVQRTGNSLSETGVPPLTESWSLDLNGNSQSTRPVHPVVSANGLVFITTAASFQSTSALTVVHLSDGSPAWAYDFGPVDSLGHPSVSGGMVYLANGKGTQSPPPQMWAFHAELGTAAWQTTFGAQWEQYWAPLVVNGRVYSDSGNYGGLSAFSVADGSTLFFNSTLEQYDGWSASYFGGSVYTFVMGNLRAHDPTTGNVLWTLGVKWNWAGYTMNTAPVFGPTSLGFVIAPPTLYAVDTATHQVVWSQAGGYSGTPAVAAGLVYGTSSGNLVVRDAADGSLAWTFTGDGALQYPPVVANGYVYVASDKNVYAVNLSTHQQVWTAPHGGWLAIASRRLLVASNTGILHAFLMSK